MYKYKGTQELLNQDTLTYQEILALKSRMQGYKNLHNKNDGLDANSYEWKEEYKITPEHTAKGLEYLLKIAFKPSKLQEQKDRFDKEGLLDEAIRSNSPMGYRELVILLQFNHFTFTGFYNATNMVQQEMGYRVYYPLWKCYNKNGYSFEYYIEGGVMNIVG